MEQDRNHANDRLPKKEVKKYIESHPIEEGSIASLSLFNP
jgi:hypothetical protein